MAIEFIKEKLLSEVKEEDEDKKIDIQTDAFEAVANLYEEVEGLRSEITELKTKLEALGGGEK